MRRGLFLGAILAAGVAAEVLSACSTVCPTISQSERQAFLAVKPEEGGYIISGGDQLQIEVWQNPNLTRSVTVRPDGRITLPLVNDVPASGDTVPQFQARLSDKLRQFVKDPLVSITVLSFTDKKIFIQGQVRNPAAYNYNGDLYLLQALTLAGGTTPFSEGCAVIVRRKGDQFLRYDIDLVPVTEGKDLRDNIALQPNDVITVH